MTKQKKADNMKTYLGSYFVSDRWGKKWMVDFKIGRDVYSRSFAECPFSIKRQAATGIRKAIKLSSNN